MRGDVHCPDATIDKLFCRCVARWASEKALFRDSGLQKVSVLLADRRCQRREERQISMTASPARLRVSEFALGAPRTIFAFCERATLRRRHWPHFVVQIATSVSSFAHLLKFTHNCRQQAFSLECSHTRQEKRRHEHRKCRSAVPSGHTLPLGGLGTRARKKLAIKQLQLAQHSQSCFGIVLHPAQALLCCSTLTFSRACRQQEQPMCRQHSLLALAAQLPLRARRCNGSQIPPRIRASSCPFFSLPRRASLQWR